MIIPFVKTTINPAPLDNLTSEISKSKFEAAALSLGSCENERGVLAIQIAKSLYLLVKIRYTLSIKLTRIR